MSLHEKIAQLFILGFWGDKPSGVLERFLALGLGGVIFFRDNFQNLKHPDEVRGLLDRINVQVPTHLPQPFLSIDQEGGQVERLPYGLFPSTVTPRAIALSKHPEALAQNVYTLMAENLVNLGFNLNYFPTLDVNLKYQNPVIGVRSFGDDPETVWRLSQIAMRCYATQGLITVGKHFPGHGNGTVDSHDKLPVLKFTQTELEGFQKAIENNLPTIMLAHGLYPGLQPEDEIKNNIPASASPFVIKNLLRKQCGFNSLVMTDDLCMGAVLGSTPEEVALRALEAGADMLLYRQSTGSEWRVFEAVVEAVKSGQILETRLDESLARIAQVKARMTTVPYRRPDMHTLQQHARNIAEQSLTLLTGSFSDTEKHQKNMLLVHPDRAAIPNYAFDQDSSPELPDCFRALGVLPAAEICYKPQQVTKLPDELSAVKAIVFVAFNAIRDSAQIRLYQQLRQAYSAETPITVVSVGTPDDMSVLPGADAYWAACSYRPPVMEAIGNVLSGKLPTG